jgi:mannitol/fructose-specific phosphotransferase system IIA component (Ntr-type)
MKLGELLTEDLILVGLTAKDKWTAIDGLLHRLVEKGRLKESFEKKCRDAVVAREKLFTTGMDHGIAIPHARVDCVDGPLAVLGMAPKGVPFLAPDGKPSTIFVLLLIPLAKALDHAKTLANIARLLGFEEVRRGLLAAKSEREALKLIREEEAQLK